MKRLVQLVLAVVCLAQAACGGGSGGGSGGGGTVSTISGTASKGIIRNGKVKIYALNNAGSRGALLAETTTDSNGKYSKDIADYSGPVIAYAFGSYTDEATGATITLSEANALRAALPALSGAATLPITALTDLAVRKAGTALTPAAIASANALVGALFNVDITGCNPVEASASSMGDASVTSKQFDYTLALAALSQIAKDSSGSDGAEKLQKALATIADGISPDSIQGATAKMFTDAVTSYLDNNAAINTVVSNRGGSPVITVGSKKGQIVLNLTGAKSNLYGANLTVSLPAGVTVSIKADGRTMCNAVIGLTPATAGAAVVGDFAPASASSPATLSIALASSTPLGSGKFLTINANVAPGTKINKDSFALSGVSFFDESGGALTGSTFEVSDASTE